MIYLLENDRWSCTFISSATSVVHVRWLLLELSRMDVLTLEQLVTQAWAVMTEEPKEIITSAQ